MSNWCTCGHEKPGHLPDCRKCDCKEFEDLDEAYRKAKIAHGEDPDYHLEYPADFVETK